MTNDTRLARRTASPVEPWHIPEWQRLWLTLQSRPWRTMAVVPAATGAPSSFSLDIAVTLARAGMLHLDLPIHVADATRVPLTSLASFMEELEHCKTDGSMVLIALATIDESPLTVSIAQAADSSLLCVLSEKMLLSHAKKTVGTIGASRFVGSVVFHGDHTIELAPVPKTPAQ